jgi:YYY domain-containing protein
MGELWSALAWYLALAGLSWLVLPLAYRWFPALAERGYGFLRPLALLLWGFVFWLLGSLGLLANDVPSLLLALLLLAGLSAWAARQLPAGHLGAWLREQRSQIVATELVFLLSFVFMLWMRASYPRIEGTEKPMELAFINAILRSPSLPPHDPWLAGYSISYYYFGYLMVAMLAKLLGVAGAVAFNLGIASVFAMGAAAAYGLVFNLLAQHAPARSGMLRWLAGLAPVLMLVMGNAEGLLEIAHARHLFWETDTSGQAQSAVWAWLDVKDLVNPPSDAPRWAPRNFDTSYWWWWRASRVINDRNLLGQEQELIDEFPAFSFVLGDLHPHVFSIPFVLLAVGLAYNTYRGGNESKRPLLGLYVEDGANDWRQLLQRHPGAGRRPLIDVYIQPEAILLAALVIGALAFINFWDLPIYAGVLAAAYALRRAQAHGWAMARLGEFLSLLLVVVGLGVLLFVPFFVGFSSQAGGILPNLINPTRGVQLWIMFLPLWAPLLLWALVQWRTRPASLLLRAGLGGLGFVLALWGASLLMARVYAGALGNTPLGAAILTGFGAADLPSLLAAALQRRAAAAGGWLSLALLLGLLGGLLAWPAKPAGRGPAYSASQFALLLALVGALLVTAPEFVYLRDQFGTRMNTVFKFYYQAWLLWSVAAAFALGSLWLAGRKSLRRTAAWAALLLALGAGLVFPLYAFADLASRPEGQALSLDGSAYLPADARAAIAWLQTADPGVLAEAVGGSYTGYARYATFSGLPGVLGWPGHESQWRAGEYEREREEAVRTLYASSQWPLAAEILQRYDVRYVIVGDLERNAYPVNEAKFQARLSVAFQNDSVTIYAVP